MYAILSDGVEIARSKIVKDEAELDRLNGEAEEATAGNWYWIPGDEDNATWPKADGYKHIHSGHRDDPIVTDYMSGRK